MLIGATFLSICLHTAARHGICLTIAHFFADYNMNLTNLQDGDWTSVAQLDFGKNGAASFSVNAA